MLSRTVFRSYSRVLRAPVAAAPRLTRSYANGSSQDSRPPIEVYGIDGTYASALYTAAVKTSTLDPVARGLQSLHQAFQRDPKLSTILNAPTLTTSDKNQIIEQLLKTANAGDNTTLKNFLQTLSANNRLHYLSGVCDRFAEIMQAARGEVELKVTSAAQLDQRMLKQIEAAVQKSPYVAEGKKLKTTPIVKPDIRGGLVVEVGDRTIDLSVSSKIARMNKLLTEAL